MTLEIPFMSAIFSMITQFIYVHMIIYRKLTQNITKDQKRVKKGPKQVKKNCKKLKMAIEIPFMSAIFYMFTQFIYVHLTIYRNQTPNITKGQKKVKKGPKQVKKMVKIKNAHRNTIFS